MNELDVPAELAFFRLENEIVSKTDLLRKVREDLMSFLMGESGLEWEDPYVVCRRAVERIDGAL